MYYSLLLWTLVGSIAGYSIDNDQFDDEKIVGGNIVKIEDYRYQVSILMDDGLWCGGSILSKDFVLTAAHCVLLAKKSLVVRAGSSFWKNGGSLHHVDYNITYGSASNTDVALLHVTEPFIFDETRQPISIVPEGNVVPGGTMAIVTGWGSVNSSNIGVLSSQLRAVEVPIVDNNACNEAYKNIIDIEKGEICAGFLEKGGKDACQGDSGGPLVIDNKQVGIVSKGWGCARSHAPGIYADVAFFNKWITEKISS